MARNSPNPGEIIKIPEILDLPVDMVEGKTVRITGKMVSHNIQDCHAVLEDPLSGKTLCVDTMLAEPLTSLTGSLILSIGEMDSLSEKYGLVLHARIFKEVSDLDLNLYYKACDKQRQYLQSRQEET